MRKTQAMFGLFKKKDPIEDFWNWFEGEQEIIFHHLDDKQRQAGLITKVTTKLKQIDKGLTVQMSPVRDNGKRELEISAEGVKELFPKVTEVVTAAPEVTNWNIMAFRQPFPKEDLGEIKINMGEFSLSCDDMFFIACEEDGHFGIELYIQNFEEAGHFYQVGYLMLDAVLGEYHTTWSLDFIEWFPLEKGDKEQMRPLVELRDVVEQVGH